MVKSGRTEQNTRQMRQNTPFSLVQMLTHSFSLFCLLPSDHLFQEYDQTFGIGWGMLVELPVSIEQAVPVQRSYSLAAFLLNFPYPHPCSGYGKLASSKM